MQREPSFNRTKKPVSDEPLPHNKEAEKALLGSIIINSDAFFDLSDITPGMFFYKVNQEIYQAITNLSLRGAAVDVITVTEELDNIGSASFSGDADVGAYIADLMLAPGNSMFATDYAEIVRQNAVRRSIIITANKMATSAWAGEDFQTVVDSAQVDFIEAIQLGITKKAQHIGVGVDKYVVDFQDRVADPEKKPGLKTGFVDLDWLLNGVKKQDLVIIAARPGMGKTALMMALADNLSVRRFDGKAGLIFSLEMSEKELINRLVARRARLNTQKLDNAADLSFEEQTRVYDEAAAIKRAPLYVVDTPGMSVSQMLAEGTRIKMMYGLDYIMVDFLQLADARSNKSLYEKVSKVARDLKNLAKQLDIPIFVASQLSRKVEDRADKRPQLSDLRDSGQIEEAADDVWGLFRSDYYEEGIRPNIAEVEVLKRRHGPTGTIDLYFDGPTITMHNLERKAMPF